MKKDEEVRVKMEFKVDARLLQAVREDVVRRIESLFSSQTKSETPRLRLSQLGLCPRATVLSIRTGVTADLSEAAGILAAGHLFEGFIAQAFEGEEIIPQFEVSLNGVLGHIDFYFPRNSFFIECKTIAAARCSPDFLPIQHHIVQVHAYLSALYEMTSVPHIAALIYFPRENPKLFQVFTFAYDESWHSELVLRIELLKHAIETGELPGIPADYEAGRFPCRWFSKISRMIVQCPFYDQCWEVKPASQASQDQNQVEDSPSDDANAVYDLDPDLEDLVAVLHSLRSQRKSIEEQEKQLRAEILKAVGKKRGRFVGREFGMTIYDEVRRQLDTKALSKVINLDEYRREVKATVVDVFRHA